MTNPDFLAILRILLEHEVEFVVVGGVCAVLQGAPVATFDLDLVHSRHPRNIERLLPALDELHAHYRTPGAERLQPEASHLSSPGHQLLMTVAGPLDLLGTVGAGRGYDQLLPLTEEMEVGGGMRVRILGLSALIQIKEELGHDKDKAVLAILRRTLEEKAKRGSSGAAGSSH